MPCKSGNVQMDVYVVFGGILLDNLFSHVGDQAL